MKDYRVREDCRLCGSTYTEVLDLGETALANEVWEDPAIPQDTFPLKLVQCDSCGHMQCPIVVNPERLFRSYSYTSGLVPAYREHLKDYAKQINVYLSEEGDRTVEIGGNDGTLGGYLDYEYLNVDPSDVEQKHGNRDKRFFSKAVAEQLRYDVGPAKVIVANHVFAHADNLHDMAEGVKHLLADDGVFFCEVGHGPTQFAGGLSVVYHEHTSYHDERSLRCFFSTHGLICESLEFNEAQGGSMRLRFHKFKGSPAKLSISNFGGFTFDLPAIKAKAAEMRGLGKAISHISDSGSGATIGIYGAPAKLTTLLTLLKLANYVRDVRVFDDSLRKVGKLVPGTKLPIRPPDADELDRCDHILIASWNFADSIMARFPGYTGTWIVPEPTVRFVPGCGA